MLRPPGPPLPLLQMTPDFSAQDLVHERTVRLANYRGQSPVLMLFLGRPISPMREQMGVSLVAELNRQRDSLQSIATVLLVGLGSAVALRTFAANLGLGLPLVHDPEGTVHRAYCTGQTWGDHPCPAQFIVDVQGRLRYYHLSSLLHPYPTAAQILDALEQISPHQSLPSRQFG